MPWYSYCSYSNKISLLEKKTQTHNHKFIKKKRSCENSCKQWNRLKLHLRASHSLFSLCLSILRSTAPCRVRTEQHHQRQAGHNSEQILLCVFFFSTTYFVVSPPLPGRLRAVVALVPRIPAVAILVFFVPEDVVVGGYAEIVVLFDEQFDLQSSWKVERERARMAPQLRGAGSFIANTFWGGTVFQKGNATFKVNFSKVR